ncbi:MAG: hypothetical protein DRH37_07485 [Deltaproteobacteria bacterium]|nr:MAG: hypothetical protein DRH37_07485 [Deltaproteobacteria bacterium]
MQPAEKVFFRYLQGGGKRCVRLSGFRRPVKFGGFAANFTSGLNHGRAHGNGNPGYYASNAGNM